MSSVLVESAQPGSQLYFPWTGTDEVAVHAEEDAVSAEYLGQTVMAKRPSRGNENVDLAGQHQPLQISTKADCSRVGQPVRIGTMMIKLLKRYGITDAEIAAGLESYAQKSCQHAAG